MQIEIHNISLPTAKDIETAVLGALVLDANALDRIPDITAEMFSNYDYKQIFNAILKLQKDNKKVDMLMIADYLGERVATHVIAELTMKVVNAANIEFHAAVLFEQYCKRELITACQTEMQKAFEPEADIFELQQRLISKLEQLNPKHKKIFQDFETIANNNLVKLKELQAKGSNITGLDTGYSRLNRLTSGWQNSDLIILAARPGTGKTAFALNIVTNLALKGYKTAFFSLEMNASQLVDRVISKITDVPANRLKSARVDSSEWVKLETTNYSLPIYIDDTAGLNIAEFKAKARRMKKEQGIDFIVVDYLQLMTTYLKGNRDTQIGDISRGLKLIAKELNVPVLALSQLNRAVETSNREPHLSDLRESGNIEQDADIVIFLHGQGEHTDEVGDINLICAKHRNGGLGFIPFDFYKAKQDFQERNKVF